MDDGPTENQLEHYGVKGMKWGVRKADKRPMRRLGGTKSSWKDTGNNKAKTKEARARADRSAVAKNRRSLSDEKLNKYIDRLSKEKKLKQLVEEDLRPGRTIAKRITSESGQKVAKTVISGLALYGVKAAFEKKFDLSDAAKYAAPKPKK